MARTPNSKLLTLPLARFGRLLTWTAACVAAAGSAGAQDTELISGSPAVPANGRSEQPHVSADGRYVVWQTLASNLVPGDGNGTWDVLLLDRETGSYELISRTPQGAAANAPSYEPTISADGRFVAFRSSATNIQAGVGANVWIHDRQLGSFEAVNPAVSLSSSTPRISPDGRFVVYVTPHIGSALDTNGAHDVYRYDRVSAALELVSISASGLQSNRDAREPSISSGGRYVVFDCWALNGAWGAAFSGFSHVWRKDMLTGALEAVSMTQAGVAADGPCNLARISANGEWVAFQVAAPNMVQLAGALQIATKHLISGQVHHVSVDAQGNPADNYSYQPEISDDGRFVAFRSTGSNLPGGGTNSYYGTWVRDMALGITRKVSLSSAATGQVSGTSNTFPGGLSASGRYCVLQSQATNLVAGDTNGFEDIFLRDISGDAPRAYGWSPVQSTGCLAHIEASGAPSASAGSGFVVSLQNVRGLQPGIFIYSRSGPASVPLFGSYLYVAAPIVRTPVQNSGGSGAACDGSFQLDFNTWAGSGSDGAIGPGSSIWGQYWSRDPGSNSGSHLSDAIEFVLAP